tara:strand:- start:201 stop:383 length:183 start_codon:yes stop_codon:yes gene_type:complete
VTPEVPVLQVTPLSVLRMMVPELPTATTVPDWSEAIDKRCAVTPVVAEDQEPEEALAGVA